MQSEKVRCDALIAELYPRMFPILLRYANYELCDAAAAEELAQETFAVACEHPDKILGSDNPSGWLVNTAKNLILNYRRRRALWADLLKPDSSDAAEGMPVTDTEKIKILYAGTVPDEDLDLIISVELCGYTYKEAGSKLGITAEACRKRVKRAEKAFRENLQKSGCACPDPASSAHNIKGGSRHVE